MPSSYLAFSSATSFYLDCSIANLSTTDRDYRFTLLNGDHSNMDNSTKWLRSPIHTEVGGRPCTLLTIGHVAHALGRTTWTVRYWTRLGLLPEPAFHLNPGNPRARRTLYPGPYVLALADIADRGYVGPRLDRDQWRRFQLDVWAAYQETVLPLTGGVADDDTREATADTSGQAASSSP